LSDIAAAGARPLGFVAALSMPADTDVEFLRGLAQGIEECVREFGIAVLGGDTKESPVLSIAGTAFGRVRKDRILLRTGAKPGDVIVVTGDLGRAGHAAKLLEQPTALRSDALTELLRPYPRIAEGLFLAESGAVTSCMDLSDELGASLAPLASMTRLYYQIEFDALPFLRDSVTYSQSILPREGQCTEDDDFRERSPRCPRAAGQGNGQGCGALEARRRDEQDHVYRVRAVLQDRRRPGGPMRNPRGARGQVV